MNWQQGNFQTYVSAVDMRCDLPGRTLLPTGTEFQYDGYKVVIDGAEATVAPPSFRSAVGRGWLRLAQAAAVPGAPTVAASAPTPSIQGLSAEGQKLASAMQGQFPGAFTEPEPEFAPVERVSRPSFAAENPVTYSGAPRATVGRADIADVTVTVGRPGEMPSPSETGAFVKSSTLPEAQPGARFPLTHEAPVGVVGQPASTQVRTAADQGVAPRRSFPLVSNESEVTRVFPLNNVAPTQTRAAVVARGEATITPVAAKQGDTNLTFNPGALVREAHTHVGPAMAAGATAAPALKPEVAARRNMRKLEVVQQKNPGFTWDFNLDQDSKVQMALGNLQWLSAIFEVEEPTVKEAIQAALAILQSK